MRHIFLVNKFSLIIGFVNTTHQYRVIVYYICKYHHRRRLLSLDKPEKVFRLSSEKALFVQTTTIITIKSKRKSVVAIGDVLLSCSTTRPFGVRG